MFVSFFSKCGAFLDFGYNMYDYANIDISKTNESGRFWVKFGSLLVMFICLYITYIKDQDMITKYYDENNLSFNNTKEKTQDQFLAL